MARGHLALGGKPKLPNWPHLLVKTMQRACRAASASTKSFWGVHDVEIYELFTPAA